MLCDKKFHTIFKYLNLPSTVVSFLHVHSHTRPLPPLPIMSELRSTEIEKYQYIVPSRSYPLIRSFLFNCRKGDNCSSFPKYREYEYQWVTCKCALVLHVAHLRNIFRIMVRVIVSIWPKSATEWPLMEINIRRLNFSGWIVLRHLL